MKVQSGMKKDGREFLVELSDLDGLNIDPNWNALGVKARFRLLSMNADLMVVEYMTRGGLISKEYAAQRASEIKAAWG